MCTEMQAARAQLAPTGGLRAGINLANFLLVSNKEAVAGVAPDVAAAIAAELDVPLSLVPFDDPSAVCDAATSGVWDIGLVGADPLRMEHMDFTPAYCEIQCNYMVPLSSPFHTPAAVDSPGVKIAVKTGAAYELWLQRNLEHAELVGADTLDGSFELFASEQLPALAGLRSKHAEDLSKAPGSFRVIEEPFMAVQQAVACLKQPDGNTAGLDFVQQFMEQAKQNGMIAALIEKHNVKGQLEVAALESS